MRWAIIRTSIFVISVVLLTASLANAQVLVKLDKLQMDSFQNYGFEMAKAGKVSVEAIGIKLNYSDDLNVYAWIINSQTRQPVWVMKRSHSERYRNSKILFKEKSNIDLGPGRYELYFYAGSSFLSNISFHGTGDFFNFLGDLLGGQDSRDWEDQLRDCYVELSLAGGSISDITSFTVTGDFPNSIIKYNELGDSEYLQTGFTFAKPMAIRIYSVYEYPEGDDNPVDYGWIINADTREKVWELDRWNSDWAGGGRKNRVYDNEIELPAGNYLLYFVTDDSHSFESFNVNPPYDPYNWGITVLPGKYFDSKAFKIYEPAGQGKPLIELTKVGDDEFLEQPFKLKNKASLRIYAIGEYSLGNREFADYGWIQDAATGAIVWNMTYSNTIHAGGAKKNRMFDNSIVLPKGEYIAYYVSDDSHCYDDWNDSPPFDPLHWGLTIFGGVDFNPNDFAELSKTNITQGSNILTKIVMVEDSEKHRERFTLAKQARIHIYAIGEGDRDEMYDYGWIVDTRTNRSVWEMSWRNTEPAGGASKNRLFNDDIILDPGTYEVNYISDGSHSFNDWNEARPNDPINWGITISIVN